MTQAARIGSAVCAVLLVCEIVVAQGSVPSARLVSAPLVELPGAIDSSNPFIWDWVDGVRELFVITSWGGVPIESSGPSMEQLHRGEPVTFVTHPGHGVWMESVVADDAGSWYGYYHHERPADECGRPERQLPRIGAARSSDRGRTWDDLGIVLDAPDGSAQCASTNRFVLGGVGDVSGILDANGQYLYLFFSQYSGAPNVRAWPSRDWRGPIETRQQAGCRSTATVHGCRSTNRQTPRKPVGHTHPARRSSRRADPFMTAIPRPMCSGAPRFTGIPISRST